MVVNDDTPSIVKLFGFLCVFGIGTHLAQVLEGDREQEYF